MTNLKKGIDKELFVRFQVYVDLVDSTLDRELNLLIANKLRTEKLMSEEEYDKILHNSFS